MRLGVYLKHVEKTTKKFAEEINFNRAYLGSIIAGRVKPSKKLVKIIVNHTLGQVTESELLEPFYRKNKENTDR